jgi:tRNA-specific 2-thiouridylase
MSSIMQNNHKENHAHPARVVVAMSGGVDSSVAAALLVEQGFEVIGMMMRLWSEPGRGNQNRCCTPDAMAQAKHVAAHLGIPFYAIDAQEPFYNHVVQYFIEGYTRGVTPNPCLVCNRQIRWEFLLNHASAFGAHYMATGHYARIREDSGRKLLLRATDKKKDQSYVLHVLNQNQLSKAIFPLGEYSKKEVRQLAKDFDLPVADRPDSQDLCFLGNDDYREFLRRNTSAGQKAGLVRTKQGEILGEHKGLAMYTIGQRKGLGLSSPKALYVLEKNLHRNELIVGDKEDLCQERLSVREVNWISIGPPSQPIRAQVKIRYTAPEVWAVIKPGENGYTDVHFDHKIVGITPGQAAVFYDKEICLGGGIIQINGR